MKILFLSDKFPPEDFGGPSRVAFNLARAIQLRGHSVFVITTTQDRDQDGEIEYEKLKIFRIYANYHGRWRAYLSLYNPQAARKIKKIIQQIKPDIVHAHNIHFYLAYHCLKIAKEYSRAVFLTAHDVMLVHYGKLEDFYDKNCLSTNCEINYKISLAKLLKVARKRFNPLRNRVIRYYLKFVDKIFSPSSELKKVLETNGISNIEIMYNGIETKNWVLNDSDKESFKKKYSLEGCKVIFFAGRISGAKGSGVMVRAIEKIKERVPNVKLLIAGDLSPGAYEMKELAKQSGVENYLCFTGLLAGNSLKAAYASSDVCVTPSICFDVFPSINLEAMALKKPVVGTCFGGTQEIVVDNETGFIVNPLNIDMLADRIIKLLNDPSLAKKMGEAGYERVVRQFNLEKLAEKHLSIFKTAMCRQRNQEKTK